MSFWASHSTNLNEFLTKCEKKDVYIEVYLAYKPSMGCPYNTTLRL